LNTYRYGFNGKEKDDEIKSEGNSYDFGARMYDPRIGRWMSVDPAATKYSGLSPYNFVLNNPIRYIDPNGEDPIDPRTGDKYNIWLAYASVFTVDNDKPSFVKVTDIDLLEAASYSSTWYGNKYGRDDQYHTGDDIGGKGYVSDKISGDARKSLKDIYGKSISVANKPGSKRSLGWFQKAATQGSYTFADDALSESDFFNINKSSFNLISVEENVITKIVNMTRNSSDDDNQYNINSVTTLDTKVGDIQTRNVKGLFGMKEEKYRSIEVTETTQKYENNKAKGDASVKITKREKIY
jgi:RHS repeat-associated protein